MINFHLKPVPHEEAAKLIEGKAVVTRDIFDRMPDEIRARAFVVTGIESHDILQALRDRIAELPAGADWDEVKADVVAGLSPWMTMEDANRRASILMRHHGFSAYAAAQARVQDELIEVFPYRQYLSTDDFAVRPTHAALNGIVLPANHPFWEKHTPPWEWNCRCDVVELTELDMEDERARDKRRKPENRRVLEGAALVQLENGQLNRGPTMNVDVRTPKERGGNYENNVRNLNLPYDEIRKRWDDQTRTDFEEWAGETEIGDAGTIMDWLLERQPAPPVPPAPSARKSPVSNAIDLRTRSQSLRATVTDAMAAIDEVHDDGALPKIALKGSPGRNALGQYDPNMRSMGIDVSPKGAWPALTTVHEVGHFIDHMAIGKPGVFATRESSSPLKPVLDRIKLTQGYQEVLKRQPRAGYFDSDEELWARAYAQYIATKSSNDELKQDLVRVRGSLQPWRQWDEQDFEPVVREIDRVFDTLNWNPKR